MMKNFIMIKNKLQSLCKVSYKSKLKQKKLSEEKQEKMSIKNACF